MYSLYCQKTQIYAIQYVSLFGLAARKARDQIKCPRVNICLAQVSETISFGFISKSLILRCLLLHQAFFSKLPQVFWKLMGYKS